MRPSPRLEDEQKSGVIGGKSFISKSLIVRIATEITSPSGLPYCPSSALRQQLNSSAMRLLLRLEYERSCGASWSTYFVRIPKDGNASKSSSTKLSRSLTIYL